MEIIKTKGRLTGQVRTSYACGDYEILDYVGKSQYVIRFINTGTTKTVFTANISNGGIADESIPNNLGKYREGQILHSDKFGDAEIIEIIKKPRSPKKDGTPQLRTYVKVRFLDTGYITECEPHNFKVNKARDYLLPNLFDVGILGYVEDLPGRLRDMKEYRLWEGIIHRCYGIKDYSIRDASYKHAILEDRWIRFDYFLEDLPYIKNYDMWKSFYKDYPKIKNIFEFDKDTIVDGNKIYSRDTCMFIPKFINAGYTTHASAEVKQELLTKLEGMDYDTIIKEARSRGLL